MNCFLERLKWKVAERPFSFAFELGIQHSNNIFVELYLFQMRLGECFSGSKSKTYLKMKIFTLERDSIHFRSLIQSKYLSVAWEFAPPEFHKIISPFVSPESEFRSASEIMQPQMTPVFCSLMF